MPLSRSQVRKEKKIECAKYLTSQKKVNEIKIKIRDCKNGLILFCFRKFAEGGADVFYCKLISLHHFFKSV
jgi:hypothetical protein